MIIFPDEGVNHQELFERVVDQFEGAVDLPSLCLAQVEKLVIGSKYDVAAAVDAEICFHKGIGQMVSSRLKSSSVGSFGRRCWRSRLACLAMNSGLGRAGQGASVSFSRSTLNIKRFLLIHTISCK